jgi:hypothetical protein
MTVYYSLAIGRLRVSDEPLTELSWRHVASSSRGVGVPRELRKRMFPFGRQLTRTAVVGVVAICVSASMISSVASSAPKPKRNKQVICSSIVTSSEVSQITGVTVGPAVNGQGLGGGPPRLSSVPYFQSTGRQNLSLPGSVCDYDYASGGQGDPNTSGPEVAQVWVMFGPVSIAGWDRYEAWQRKNAFAGAAGNVGMAGTGTLAYQSLGSRAFEMSLSNYWENSQTQMPVTASEEFALSRHGNIVWVFLSPVLVSSSGETDSTEGMIRSLVGDALSKGSF